MSSVAQNDILFQIFVSGIPELSIPVEDTHFVKKVDVSLGSSVINMKVLLRNLTVTGMASGTVLSVKLVKMNTQPLGDLNDVLNQICILL